MAKTNHARGFVDPRSGQYAGCRAAYCGVRKWYLKLISKRAERAHSKALLDRWRLGGDDGDRAVARRRFDGRDG